MRVDSLRCGRSATRRRCVRRLRGWKQSWADSRNKKQQKEALGADRGWNKDIIHQTFSPEEAELVLQMPFPDEGSVDNLIWEPDKKGVFSVKSAYNMFHKYYWLTKDLPEGSKGQEKKMAVWIRSWKMNIKPKLKMFLWKCLHNILPTTGNLWRKKLKDDPRCSCCGTDLESLEHLFFFCERAKRVCLDPTWL